jgi:hypothetical protein
MAMSGTVFRMKKRIHFYERGETMKNPFMSMFLSGANRMAGAARGQATAAVKREAAKNTRQMTKAWTDAMFPGLAAPRRKKPSGK